ncbi:MAG TPA: hypothetical protein VF715_10340 [Thermoleophilaceae bacterium]
MTREEALARAEAMNAEAGESADFHWLAQEAEGDWRVVKVPGLPGGRGPLKEVVEARPRPPTADDPRPSSVQQVPPYGAA